MQITLLRKKLGSDYIDGTIVVNGESICDTVESATNALNTGLYDVRLDKCAFEKRQVILIGRQNQVDCEVCAETGCMMKSIWDKENNILAKAVADGLEGEELLMVDRTTRTNSAEAIKKLKHHVCNRITTGNGVANKNDGRIVVGKRVAPGFVINSKETYTKFFDRIHKSISRGHSVTLEIV